MQFHINGSHLAKMKEYSSHAPAIEFMGEEAVGLNGWQLAKMKKSIPDMSLP